MKNKKYIGLMRFSVLVAIAIFIFALGINEAGAYSEGNENLNISYQLITQGNAICGRYYTPTCFFNKNTIEKNIKIEYLKEWQENITEYAEKCTNTTICKEITGNATSNYDCSYPQTCITKISGSHIEKKCDWLPISDGKEMSKGQFNYFDISSGGCHLVWKQAYNGKTAPLTSSTNADSLKTQSNFISDNTIDIIPSIKIGAVNLVMDEMAWWNTDWQNAKDIIMTNPEAIPHFEEKIEANATGLTLATGNCSKELVLIDNSSNQIDMQVLYNGTAPNNWCYIMFKANLSASETLAYTLYYNNPSANEIDEVMQYFRDDFNRANSDTVGNGWAEVEASSSDVKILNNALYTVISALTVEAVHSSMGTIDGNYPHTFEAYFTQYTTDKRWAYWRPISRNSSSTDCTALNCVMRGGSANQEVGGNERRWQTIYNELGTAVYNNTGLPSDDTYLITLSLNNQSNIYEREMGKTVKASDGSLVDYSVLSNPITKNTYSGGVQVAKAHPTASAGTSLTIDYWRIYKGIVYRISYNYSIGAEQSPPADTSFTVSLPAGTTIISFISLNKSSKEIQAQNQTSIAPIINITNTGNIAQNFKIRILNETPTWVSLYGDDAYPYSSGVIVNATAQTVISNLASGLSKGIWLWSNFTSAPKGTNTTTFEVSSQQYT
jgi:hypothetical protein